MRARAHERTFESEDASIGLTSFMVDIAGALVSPRMSTPNAELPRGRTMLCAKLDPIFVLDDTGDWRRRLELTCSDEGRCGWMETEKVKVLRLQVLSLGRIGRED
jgi:hypothetical protein